jgi:hypothetical protein
VIEVARQIAVRPHALPEDVGYHLLVRRAVEHFALVPVLEAQHFLSVDLVASRFAPQLRRLERWHEDLERPGPVLFLAHDLFDPFQHPKPERQPRVAAGRLLADHA